MSYRVLYAEQFRQQLNEQLDYFERKGAPTDRVSNWLNELLLLMDGLEESPLRFPVATVEIEIEGIELRRVAINARGQTLRDATCHRFPNPVVNGNHL